MQQQQQNTTTTISHRCKTSKMQKIVIVLYNERHEQACTFLSLYGCELWNLNNPAIAKLCTAWRAGLRRNWNLPYNYHTAVLRMLSDVLPLQDLICKRSISFANKCLISESDLVRYVAQYSILYGRMHSTLGHNVQYTVVNVIPLYHTALYVHILLFNERVIAGTLVMITTGRCLFLN